MREKLVVCFYQDEPVHPAPMNLSHLVLKGGETAGETILPLRDLLFQMVARVEQFSFPRMREGRKLRTPHLAVRINRTTSHNQTIQETTNNAEQYQEEDYGLGKIVEKNCQGQELLAVMAKMKARYVIDVLFHRNMPDEVVFLYVDLLHEQEHIFTNKI